MDKRILIFLVGLVGITPPALTWATHQAVPLNAAPVAMTPKAPMNPAMTPNKVVAAETPKPVPSYQLYTYYGDRYRDPFIPLTGITSTDQLSDRPPQIGSLLLKVIIQEGKR